jgi:hypothetical protein
VDLYLLPDLRERGAGLFLGHVPPGRDFTLNLYGAHRAVLDVQLDMDARPLLRLVHNRDAEAQWIELRRAHLEKELIPEDPPASSSALIPSISRMGLGAGDFKADRAEFESHTLVEGAGRDRCVLPVSRAKVTRPSRYPNFRRSAADATDGRHTGTGNSRSTTTRNQDVDVNTTRAAINGIDHHLARNQVTPLAHDACGRRTEFRRHLPLGRCDGEQSPFAGHPLEHVSAAVIELEP